jgi:hypothetical protein
MATLEQIAYALRQAELGTPVKHLNILLLILIFVISACYDHDEQHLC